MKNILFTIVLFFSVICNLHTQVEFINYDLFISELNFNGTDYIILRKFKLINNTDGLIALNPNNLETSIIYSKANNRVSWNYLEKKYNGTTYMMLRSLAKQYKKGLQNSGIQNIFSKSEIIITTDLCPSSNKLDKYFYEKIYNIYTSNSLTKKGANNKSPLPVGIAITGKWIKKHKKDLRWLLEREEEKELKISWINHSFNHNFIRGEEYKSNFLLIKGTNIKNEVFKTEELMLNEGLKMSIYFRFPGLISNEKIYNKLLDYGLIPIGSDSWISKGQYPKSGSIVLVHTNGNNKKGKNRFIRWYNENINFFKIQSINQVIYKYFCL